MSARLLGLLEKIMYDLTYSHWPEPIQELVLQARLEHPDQGDFPWGGLTCEGWPEQLFEVPGPLDCKACL